MKAERITANQRAVAEATAAVAMISQAASEAERITVEQAEVAAKAVIEVGAKDAQEGDTE